MNEVTPKYVDEIEVEFQSIWVCRGFFQYVRVIQVTFYVLSIYVKNEPKPLKHFNSFVT